MSTGTPTSILGLNVFKSTDSMLYDEVNANSQQLDTLPPTVCLSTDRPTTNLYQGRLIWESDTKKLYMYDASTSAWKLVQNTYDTGWIAPASLASGWTNAAGSTFQVRQVGDRVHFRGGIVNASFVNGYTTAATLPGSITFPATAVGLPVSSNTSAARSANMNTDGTISIYSSVASGSAYFIGGGYLV